jgi:hypothetical protein
MSVLLIMLASGWTLTYEKLAEIDEDFQSFMAIGLTLIHILLAGLDFIDIDASHKYHDY